ncbi:DUF2794 domain-containing protein [Oceaniradius stylonematis]|uniref:DUF2794 domain-containing protein n=1 Tax=Oceaniradius stylonematis TaxID=2184161 RepID=A0A3A8AIB3_9HYPH|nr:DUF2794 domain-containing protein [Oceaniradius stylonematis]RNC96785.1 MAG: DUF2794 domain-containing protein [Oricola sp.]
MNGSDDENAQPGQGAGGNGAGASGGNVVALSQARRQRQQDEVRFERRELDQILRVYSFMVAGGEWRDYGISHLKDRAVFAVFRRTSEMPLYRIEKNPRLARRQGAYAVINASGMVLKRGHDLAQVLRLFDKQIRLVQSN